RRWIPPRTDSALATVTNATGSWGNVGGAGAAGRFVRSSRFVRSDRHEVLRRIDRLGGVLNANFAVNPIPHDHPAHHGILAPFHAWIRFATQLDGLVGNGILHAPKVNGLGTRGMKGFAVVVGAVDHHIAFG